MHFQYVLASKKHTQCSFGLNFKYIFLSPRASTLARVLLCNLRTWGRVRKDIAQVPYHILRAVMT